MPLETYYPPTYRPLKPKYLGIWKLAKDIVLYAAAQAIPEVDSSASLLIPISDCDDMYRTLHNRIRRVVWRKFKVRLKDANLVITALSSKDCFELSVKLAVVATELPA